MKSSDVCHTLFGVLLLAVAIRKHLAALRTREALDSWLVDGGVMLELSGGRQNEVAHTAAVDLRMLSRHVSAEGALRLVVALADVTEARVVERTLLLVLEASNLGGMQSSAKRARMRSLTSCRVLEFR